MRTRRSWRNQDRLYTAIGRDLARAAAADTAAPVESLYQAVIRLGIDHDHHESDLYLPATAQVCTLLKTYKIEPYTPAAPSFRHAVHGTRWLDVPFKYDPWWEARRAQRGGNR